MRRPRSVSLRQGVSFFQARRLLRRQPQRLAGAERLGIVEVGRGVAHAVAGNVRGEGKGEVVVGEEGVLFLIGAVKADVMGLQDAPRLGQIRRGEDLAHVACVGRAARTRIEQVQAGEVVDIAGAERLEHHQARLLGTVAQKVDLVGIVKPGAGKAVGRHEIELFQIGQRRAVVDLNHDAADAFQERIEPTGQPPLVNFQAVIIEEIGILLIAQGLPRHHVQTHGILLMTRVRLGLSQES